MSHIITICLFTICFFYEISLQKFKIVHFRTDFRKFCLQSLITSLKKVVRFNSCFPKFIWSSKKQLLESHNKKSCVVGEKRVSQSGDRKHTYCFGLINKCLWNLKNVPISWSCYFDGRKGKERHIYAWDRYVVDLFNVRLDIDCDTVNCRIAYCIYLFCSM